VSVILKSWDNSVGVVTGYGLNDWMIRCDSWWGLGIFIFDPMFRPNLGTSQPPIQWVPGALSLGVKWASHEADCSPPSRAKVKECIELYLQSPNMPSWHGAQLKHKNNLDHIQTPCGIVCP